MPNLIELRVESQQSTWRRVSGFETLRLFLDVARLCVPSQVFGRVVRRWRPCKRGWVKEPGDWPWSSWRYYFLQEASLLAMDRVP